MKIIRKKKHEEALLVQLIEEKEKMQILQDMDIFQKHRKRKWLMYPIPQIIKSPITIPV